jgi:probable rRNA maturation factor
MAVVNFFTEDIDFKIPYPRKTSAWIKASVEKERKVLRELNYIFCSDSHLLNINREYLNHTTLTDIITFDSSEQPKEIAGDIFISIERVAENARKFKTDFVDELNRVMIHGALHLIGYSDKSSAAKIQMRKKEDRYLSLRKKPWN